MPLEIERKFLVRGEFRDLSYCSFPIRQGYLSTAPERTVRIRICGEKGFITIKGNSSISGESRYEWEKEITLNDAIELMELCEPGVITKTRYLVRHGSHIIEVDEFRGNNSGLILAEVELRSADESFTPPDWFGEEVTGNPEYYNSYLCKKEI